MSTVKIYELRSSDDYLPIDYSGNTRLIAKYLISRYLKDRQKPMYGNGLQPKESRIYEIEMVYSKFYNHLGLFTLLKYPYPITLFPNNIYPFVQYRNFKYALPPQWRNQVAHTEKKYRLKLGSQRVMYKSC